MDLTTRNYYFALRLFHSVPAASALRMAKARAKAEDIGITFDWGVEEERPESVFGEASYYECESCGAIFYYKGDCPNCDNQRVRFHDTGVYYDPTAEHLYCVAKGPNGGGYSIHSG